MTERQGIYDSTDPAAIDAAASAAARRDHDDDETIRVWMNHPKGRDLLYRHVYETCHLGRTFVAVDENGHSDTHRTYLDLGERNIGAWWDERLRRHAELYMLMLKEQEIDRQAHNAQLLKQNEKQDTDNG
jgi:hypothetical protein